MLSDRSASIMQGALTLSYRNGSKELPRLLTDFCLAPLLLPQQAKLDAPGTRHHVMIRGIAIGGSLTVASQSISQFLLPFRLMVAHEND